MSNQRAAALCLLPSALCPLPSKTHTQSRYDYDIFVTVRKIEAFIYLVGLAFSCLLFVNL